jgi:hypothetical protein
MDRAESTHGSFAAAVGRMRHVLGEQADDAVQIA